MPARSLYKLATEACIANLRHLFDVGETPYHVVRPVLMKIGNPQQLREIELASPQICIADAEVWRSLIKRDIPNWERKRHEPNNPKNWWKIYRKLKREADEEAKQGAAALEAQLNQLSAEKESQHITFDHSLKIPGGKRRIRPPHQQLSKSVDASTLTFRSGSRTKTTTGKSILQKARREAREASSYGSGSVGGSLATPTHRLGTTPAMKKQMQTAGMSTSAQSPPPPRGASVQKEQPLSLQAAREEAAQRRERALRQGATVSQPGQVNQQGKRNASNVFLPNKKRRV